VAVGNNEYFFGSENLAKRIYDDLAFISNTKKRNYAFIQSKIKNSLTVGIFRKLVFTG
jgi:hypothetical protein